VQKYGRTFEKEGLSNLSPTYLRILGK